jgi:DNA replication protein DnaC
MLTEEDFSRFKEFRVSAMGAKLREIIDESSYDELTFEEKVKMMIDAQVETKQNNKINALNRDAKFKLQGACIEEIIYLPDRKISKDRIMRLAECKWVDNNENLVLISKTGCGKSYIAQALGNAACRNLHSVRYVRMADMFEDLDRCRLNADGSYYEHLDKYKSVKLLIIDDFMTTPITTQSAVELFEIMEARESRASTLIASQLEPNEWYLRIEGEMIADSTLNRIATAARYFDIAGPNMREYFAKLRPEE